MENTSKYVTNEHQSGSDISQKDGSAFGYLESYKLPNDMIIAHLNKYETDYLYEEIFKERVYLKNGISIGEEDCVFDVGANIGIFTLFIHHIREKVHIFAFEPSPPVFEILYHNTRIYDQNVQLFNCGLSDECTTKEFTFYPRSSVFSGYYADYVQDEKTIQSIVLTQLQGISSEAAKISKYTKQLMRGRLERKTFSCPVRTLSSVIEECQIKCIDLLKIDVEKSELAVLKGIQTKDWIKIKQIVLEVHDEEILSSVTNLLREQNYSIVVDQETIFKDVKFYNVFARR